jgi:aerobic-type carbon monoxide dehydrogenase small subunit (CoxS/CutS family)
MAGDQPAPEVIATLTVNGRPWSGAVAPGERLLTTLRERLGLTGAKPACERGECGACTVLIGERPRVSCITAVLLVDEPVTTVEGLAEQTSVLRAALADTGGFQCGYCTPGQVVTAAALAGQHLPEAEIRHRMAGNICRCTGYTPIVDAIRAS